MSQDSVVVESIPKCGCGRSLHMPYCDGSHGRSDAQYAEWKLQTEQEKLQATADKEQSLNLSVFKDKFSFL